MEKWNQDDALSMQSSLDVMTQTIHCQHVSVSASDSKDQHVYFMQNLERADGLAELR